MVEFDVKDNYLNEESYASKLTHLIEKGIFLISLKLSIGAPIPPNIKKLFFIIETIQLISFFFDKRLNAWEGSNIADWYTKIFGAFFIVYYIQNDTSSNVNFMIAFYLCQCIVASAILISVYIIFTHRRKKKKATKLFDISLKIFFDLNDLILYLPFLDLFLTGITILSDNVVHKISASISIVLLLTISILQKAFIYESRYTGRNDMYLLIFRTSIVLLISFKDWSTLCQIFLILGPTIVFLKTFKSRVYYDENVNKLSKIQVLILFWCGCCLFLDLVGINNCTAFIWLLGLPIVVTIPLKSVFFRYDLILYQTDDFKSIEDARDVLNYISILLCHFSNNQIYEGILQGLIETHRITCKFKTCPTKRRSPKIRKITRVLMAKGESDDLIFLIEVIESLYLKAIRKYPNDPNLKMQYVLYTLDIMKSKQLAMQMLIELGSNLSIDKKFHLYRLRHILEEEIKEEHSQQDTQSMKIEALKELTIQAHMNKLMNSLEAVANLHRDFWNILSDTIPNLSNLEPIFLALKAADYKIEHHWQELGFFKYQPPSLERLFIKYVLLLKKDFEKGKKCFEKHKMNLDFFAKGNSNSMFEESNNSCPTLCISAEDEKLGFITKNNLAFSQAFGYFQSDLRDKKINYLMPDLFAVHHDKFLERYINLGNIRSENLYKIIVVKHKNNYIIVCRLYFKQIATIESGLQFVGNFHIEKSLSPIAHILTDPNGTVLHITSTCINLLNFDWKALNNGSLRVTDIVPDLFMNFDRYESKNGMDVDCPNGGGSLQVKASKIVFREGDTQGYLIRILKPMLNPLFYTRREISPSTKEDLYLKLKFYPKDLTYYGSVFKVSRKMFLQYVNQASKENSNIEKEESIDFMELKSSPLIAYKNRKSTAKIELEKRRRKMEHNAEDIKVMHLVNNQIIDEHQFLELQENESDEENNQKSELRLSEGKDSEMDHIDNIIIKMENTIQTQSEFVNLLSTVAEKPKFKALTASILAVSLLVIGMSIFIHIQSTGEFDKFSLSFKLLSYSNELNDWNQAMVNKIVSMLLVKLNVTEVDQESRFRKEMVDNANSVSDLMNKFQKFSNLYMEKEVNMVFRDSNALTEKPFKIAEAIQQVITKTVRISTMSLSQYTFENDDIYFIVFNLLNNLAIALEGITDYSKDILIDAYISNNAMFMILLFGSIGLFALSLPLMMKFYYTIARYRLIFLKSFLEIPLKMVKRYARESQDFANNIRIGEEGDDEENDKIFTSEGDEGVEWNKNTKMKAGRIKKRKFAVLAGDKINFFTRFLFFGMFFQGYFVLIFMVSTNILTTMKSSTEEFINMNSLTYLYSFGSNNLKTLLMDSNFKVKNDDPLKILELNINMIVSANNKLNMIHSNTRYVYDLDYLEKYKNVMQSDFCKNWKKFNGKEIKNCEKQIEGLLKEGVELCLGKYIEAFNNIIDFYLEIKNNTNYTIKAALMMNDSFDYCGTKNKSLMIFCFKESDTVNLLRRYLVRPAFLYIANAFLQFQDRNYSSTNNLRLNLMMLFVVLIIGIYLFFWTPFLRRNQKKTGLVVMMPSLIPLDQMKEVQGLKDFIRIIKADLI